MVITNNNIEMTSQQNNNIEMCHNMVPITTLKWRHNMVITNNNIEMTSQHGDYQ